METFWIIITGSLVAASCGILGSFLVLRKMSLLGDAISHAVLPGIVIAFLISGSRAVLPMFIGALIFGLFTTYLIETFHRKWSVQEDASIGIVFTALFAFGVVLISMYTGNIDLDHECVLYGEIAYTPWDLFFWGETSLGPRPVWILSIVFLFNLGLVALLYKELKIVSFDAASAVAMGFNATLVHYFLMGAVSITTVASFESVGAILVVAMLIVPGASAQLWSHRLKTILLLSVIIGIVSAVLGYALATYLNSSIAGAISVVMGIIFALSFLFSPGQGMISRFFQHWKLGLKMAADHILLSMARGIEQNAYKFESSDLIQSASAGRLMAKIALLRLIRRKFLVRENDKFYTLNSSGEAFALELLQKHRLWELYLNQIGLPEDHLHRPADEIEHFIDDDLKVKLLSKAEGIEKDPHGRRIPSIPRSGKK